MELLYLGDLDEDKVQQARKNGRSYPRFETPANGLIFPRSRGILHASPLDSNYGLLQWIEDEAMTIAGVEFLERELARPMWVLEVDPEAKTYQVLSQGDLRRFRRAFPCPERGRRWGPTRHICRLDHTDWIGVSESYDAFWLTSLGFQRADKWWRCVDRHYWFRGETLVIFNLAIITRVERHR